MKAWLAEHKHEIEAFELPNGSPNGSRATSSIYSLQMEKPRCSANLQREARFRIGK